MFRHFHQLVPCEIKVGAFPVVNENRAAGLFVLASAEVIADCPVETVADGFQTVCAVDHSCLRCVESFPVFQFTAEVIRMDTHEKSGLSALVFFCLSQEITAVQEGKTVTVSVGLCGVRGCQDHKRVVVVAGSSSGAAHRLNAVVYLRAGKQTLHSMTSVKADKVKAAILKICTCAHDAFQINRGLSFIFHSYASGNNILFFQNSVIEMDNYLLCAVFQCDDQGVRSVFVQCVECGQTRQGIFSFHDLSGFVSELTGGGTGCVTDPYSTLPVVTVSVCGKLLGKGVEGIGTIIACRVRIAGKSPVSSCIQIGVIKYLCPFSKPCVYQKSQVIHFHLVHTVFGEQGK